MFGLVPRDTPWILCWGWKGTLRPPGLQAASEWDGSALPNLKSGKRLPSTSGLGRAGAWGRTEQRPSSRLNEEGVLDTEQSNLANRQRTKPALRQARASADSAKHQGLRYARFGVNI